MYAQQLKKISKEIEDTKQENSRLKELVKQIKQTEQAKMQDLERQLFEKSHKESRDIMQLAEQNDQLVHKTTTLNNELKSLMQQIDHQSDTIDKFQKENLYLKKKVEMLQNFSEGRSGSIERITNQSLSPERNNYQQQ